MMAICPVCDKLTHATTAPRDPLGRPRVRIAEHERPVASILGCPTVHDDGVRCGGSRRCV